MHFAPLPTTTSPMMLAAAAAAAAAAESPVHQRVPHLCQLFETAAAVMRRRVYAEAQKRGLDRLAWPGLVSSVDDRELAKSTTVAHSSLVDAVASNDKAR